MRRKHTQKKHRILTLAKQTIPNLPSSQSLLLQGIPPDIDPEVQDTLQAKDYEQFSKFSQFTPQQINEPVVQMKKQKFKECKIRQLLEDQNYSPTHSDFDYIDTMDNYKSYLNKSHTLQIDNKKSTHSIRIQDRTKNKGNQQNDRQGRVIKTAIGQNRNKHDDLTVIKEKIDKVKTLQSRYKSPDQPYMKIYDKIQKIKLQEKGIKLSDSFCLLSVNQYVEMTKKLQGILGGTKSGAGMSKIVCYKASRKPLSQEAKKWFCPKAYRTERNKIDPEGLLNTINLEKWNDRKKPQPKFFTTTPKSTLNNSSKFISEENAQEQSISKKMSKNTFSLKPKKQTNRPSTAPHRKIAQKCKTQTIQLNISNISHQQLKPKPVNSFSVPISKSNNLMLPLRKKVKGVKHMARERFDWKEFKSESERCQQIQKKFRSKTQTIFEYPWNWIKFQDTNQIHARSWKS